MKRNSVDWAKGDHKHLRVDACMREVLDALDFFHVPTLGSCCGHGKYPMSIVVRFPVSQALEIFSGKILVRNGNKRFYKKDSEGFYYIPEVSK